MGSKKKNTEETKNRAALPDASAARMWRTGGAAISAARQKIKRGSRSATDEQNRCAGRQARKDSSARDGKMKEKSDVLGHNLTVVNGGL